MRRAFPCLALASFLALGAPIAAQGTPEPAVAALHQRATVLDRRIDAALQSGRLSRSRATTLHTAVGRVQTSAGNYEARNGGIPAGELNRLDRQLSNVEAALPGMPSPQRINLRATADMRSRLAAADDRIVSAQQHGKLPAARAAALRRQIAAARQDMTQSSRRRGFVSAAELASYDRLVVSIDAELSAHAGDHPYGRDMLPAQEHSYGNDALPSAEVTAFQKTDARLRYRNARIERDARGCAVYQGTASDGRVRREALRNQAGRPICSPR
ncbi:hypothetical protein SAMN05192583_3482 [Sphingomonas gellani]|uniref:Uncharacterized protein n=1 Tax=Sphingomonas gellani TaxID=1166340 RepID=A0A1H8J5J6_9SPHN|nr:hypothetical protein [Sphingomonas gellani]SEN75725.1 hypothetical protein SAMN05192583_3482 [Sphingomonas gellani]